MNEKIKIFLAFLMCWVMIRIFIFLLLSLLNFKIYIGGIKNFLVAMGTIILGVIAMPFSAFWDDWWYFLILTFLYFLFGGGTGVFITLVLLGMLIIYLPSIIGFLIVSSQKKEG